MGRADISKDYNKIKNYQAYVHKARWTLPMIAFSFLLLSFWLPHFMQKNTQLEFVKNSEKNQEILNSRAALMSEPKFKGSSNHWDYEITAQASHNASAESAQIDFILPHAVMVNENEEIYADANSGRWISMDEVLELSGHVNLEHSNSYYVESDQARLHTKEEVIYVPSFAQGAAKFGKFEAEEAQIEDQGQIIRLLGESRVTFSSQKEISPFSSQNKETGETP